MKKILAILCAMLIFALPVVAFAEGEDAPEIETEYVRDQCKTTTDLLIIFKTLGVIFSGE